MQEGLPAAGRPWSAAACRRFLVLPACWQAAGLAPLLSVHGALFDVRMCSSTETFSAILPGGEPPGMRAAPRSASAQGAALQKSPFVRAAQLYFLQGFPGSPLHPVTPAV